MSRLLPVSAQGRSGPGEWIREKGRLLAERPFWPAIWTAILIAFALRAPWFGAPLGNDEGGLAYVADHWQSGGPFAYGHYFLDRPPLLVGVFRIAAETGGTTSVRVIGALTASALVIGIAFLARRLGGNRAGAWGALLATTLVSSPSLGSVYTPAELVAALPSLLSVLALVTGLQRRGDAGRLFAAAGFLAVAALLVKQSFGDALVAGLGCVAALAILERDGRRAARLLGFYLGGACVALACLEVLEFALGMKEGAMAYALIGFRIDGLSALAGSSGGLPARFAGRLLGPLLYSGLGLVTAWGVAGLIRMKGDRVLQVTLGGWAAGGLAGVLLGGSYWPHYLIELIPFSVVAASLVLARIDVRIAGVTATALAALGLGGAIVGSTLDQKSETEARTIGEYVAARSLPSDTIYVRYSQPNITFYSGLRTPYPYDWSLMLRTIPDAQPRLRELLRSRGRPTWVVDWESDGAYGLDTNGATTRLLKDHYRRAGSVCGTPLLLERGVARPTKGGSAAAARCR